MQPEDRDSAYLWDMWSAAGSILRFTAGVRFEDYVANELLRRATERSLQILGEAARRVSEELKSAHPEIPWRAIVAQRNVIVHDYVDLSDERVWEVVQRHLPPLMESLEKFISPVP
jgi:uncharacterized protein with HEPN domain